MAGSEPELEPYRESMGSRLQEGKENKPGSLEALWQLLHAAWQAIPVDTVQNLVHSMLRRCAAVIASKGHCTKC